MITHTFTHTERIFISFCRKYHIYYFGKFIVLTTSSIDTHIHSKANYGHEKSRKKISIPDFSFTNFIQEAIGFACVCVRTCMRVCVHSVVDKTFIQKS